jgi:tetratricopeptide (TPR) repeat protein
MPFLLFEVKSMLINCGKCGASVTEKAIYCATCGAKLAESKAGVPPKSPDSPLTKAASALAKASGLTKSQPTSRFSFLVRGLSIAAALLLVLSAYLVYRNQTSAGTVSVLNLVSPLDRLNQLVSLGRMSLAQNDIKTAIAKFEEAERVVPNNTDVIKELADLYDADGQVDNAVAKYSRVIELDAKNVEARLQRAEIQLNRGLWKEAIEDYQYLAVNAPQSEQAARARQILSSYTVNRSLDSLAGKQAMAGRRGKPGLQLPEVDGFQPRLAVTLPSLVGDMPTTPPTSLSSTEEASSASALARQHKQQGQIYLNAKMFYPAIKTLQDARRLAPDDSDLNYLLGQAYFSLKQYGQARRYFEQCDSGVYAPVARSAAQNARKNEQAELKKQAKKAKKEDSSDE